jgi:hypothetical protein
VKEDGGRRGRGRIKAMLKGKSRDKEEGEEKRRVNVCRKRNVWSVL